MPAQSSPNQMSPHEEDPEAAFEDGIPSNAETSDDAPLARPDSLPTEAEIRTDDEEASSRPR